MESNPVRELEFIDGTKEIHVNAYHSQSLANYSALPRSTEHPRFESVSERAERLKRDNERTKELIELGNELRARDKETNVNTPVKRKYKKAPTQVKMYIMNAFKESQGDINPRNIAAIYHLNEETVRKYIAKLKKGESIISSAEHKGRHKIIGDIGAKILYDAFTTNKVHSDKEAAELLASKGIKCSRQTVQKFVTDGSMEKLGYKSLTYKCVSFRGKDAQSDANKKKRIEAMTMLLSYMHDNYHPVFIDETHWSSGWKWNRQRGIKGEKAVCDYKPKKYQITAISAISDSGPVYTLLLCKSSVTTDKFCDFMRQLLDRVKHRKVVFFMDNAPIHDHNMLKEMVENIENKEIVFNAPYSPECNPIEKFFAEWKRRVQTHYDAPPNQEEMVNFIEEEFFRVPVDLCLDLINDLRDNILQKVLNKENL